MAAKPPYVMGIDLGTGGCKVAVYDLEGGLVAAASKEYPVYHPRPEWAEQDPGDWWRAVVECVRSVLKVVRPGDIEAVGLTSQREVFIPIDREGNVLTRGIIWLDRRTLDIAFEVKRTIGKRVFEITGCPVEYLYSALRLMWLRRERPSIFRSIWKILFCKDYIAYKLTGSIITDYSMASRTLLLDIRKLTWSSELCDLMDIPMEILPDLRGSWEVAGEVTGRASLETGLRKGTPVIIGGGDRPCEALGAGAIDEGFINIGTGTGSCFEVPLRSPKPDLLGRFGVYAHVVPGLWEYEITVNATGGSLRWFRDNFCHEEVRAARERSISPYDVMLEEASKIPPGADGLFYYPYLWGARAPKFNPYAKGVFIGVKHGHRRAHFIRAILEGVAFNYAETLEIIEDMGIRVKRVTMTGGEARGRLWNIIKASVMNRRIHIPRIIDAASLGAAILASVGSRLYSTIEDAVKSMVRMAETYEPDPKLAEVYRGLYEKYKRVYAVIEESFKIL